MSVREALYQDYHRVQAEVDKSINVILLPDARREELQACDTLFGLTVRSNPFIPLDKVGWAHGGQLLAMTEYPV